MAIFFGMGALVGSFGDRGGTYLQRFSRTMTGRGRRADRSAGRSTDRAVKAVFAVLVVGVLAVVSALMSSINATLSFAGLQMLVYVAISGGVVGRVPILAIIPAFLVGAAWSMFLSFVQSRFDHAEDEPREMVVAPIRAIAACSCVIRPGRTAKRVRPNGTRSASRSTRPST